MEDNESVEEGEIFKDKRGAGTFALEEEDSSEDETGKTTINESGEKEENGEQKDEKNEKEEQNEQNEIEKQEINENNENEEQVEISSSALTLPIEIKTNQQENERDQEKQENEENEKQENKENKKKKEEKYNLEDDYELIEQITKKLGIFDYKPKIVKSIKQSASLSDKQLRTLDQLTEDQYTIAGNLISRIHDYFKRPSMILMLEEEDMVIMSNPSSSLVLGISPLINFNWEANKQVMCFGSSNQIDFQPQNIQNNDVSSVQFNELKLDDNFGQVDNLSNSHSKHSSNNSIFDDNNNNYKNKSVDQNKKNSNSLGNFNNLSGNISKKKKFIFHFLFFYFHFYFFIFIFIYYLFLLFIIFFFFFKT